MNLDKIRKANAVAGHHFFEPGTLRFFASRIHGTVYGGCYFVTSEQFKGSRAIDDGPRLFTVRRASDDGSVDTVGEFQGYETRAAAHAAARKLGEVTR